MISKTAYILTIGVVVLAPLPFGSVQLGWMTLWSALLGLSLALASLEGTTAKRLHILVPIFAVAFIYGAGVWLQTIPDPSLVPAHSIWSEASEVLGIANPARVTVSAGQPWFALGNPLLMLLAFLCAFLIGADRRRAKSLLKAVAYSGTAYALYGLVGFWLAPTSLLWIEKTAYVANLSGTFVNRSVAATYFGTCSILWLTFLLVEIRRSLPRGGNRRWQTFVKAVPTFAPTLAMPGVGLMLCLVSTFLTASRAGVLLTLVALAVAFALSFIRLFPRGAVSGLAVAGVAIATLLFVELWGGAVALRLAYGGLFDADRWQVYRTSLAIIRDNPLLGTGLGTFAEVFPAYKPPDMSSAAFWDRAHNTLLETTVELGVPVAGALAALWAYLLVKLLQGAWTRRRGAIFPIAGTAVGLLGSTHSLVDFPLQFSGYGIVFAAVLGCALSQSQSEATGHSRDSATETPVRSRQPARRLALSRQPR